MSIHGPNLIVQHLPRHHTYSPDTPDPVGLDHGPDLFKESLGGLSGSYIRSS